MKEASVPIASRSTASPPNHALRVIAPLAALVYPAIIWLGSRTSPIVLAISLAVPVLGLVVSYRIGLDARFPRARRIAQLAVAAPPMFSLFGGWLDFQHAIPTGSVGVWIPLWSALTLVAAAERPSAGPPSAPGRRLAMAHGLTAAAILLFVVAHLINHLAGLLGGDAHVAVMHTLRTIYRHPVVEPVLLAAVAFQIATGGALLRRARARSTGRFDALQAATGVYLMLFLLSHTSAVLRAHLRGVDTNWAWLSGGELLTDPWSARLVPYYFLAVVAFGVHGACGLRVVALGHGRSPAFGARLVVIAAAISVLVSALILAGLFRA